jgi:hypothetical protein
MPETLRPRLDEGTFLEPIILDRHAIEYGYRAATYAELVMLKEQGVIAGYNPEMGQVQAHADVGKTARIRCHPDRIATHSTGKKAHFFSVEAKAFGDDMWDTWMRRRDLVRDFPGYAWQITAQMMSTGLTGILVVGHKDKSEGDEIGVFEIDVKVYEEPPFPFAKLKSRVLKAEAQVNAEEIPACQDGKWPCGYFKEAFCLGKPPDDVIELEDETLGSLCALFFAYGVDMAKTDEQKAAEKSRDEVKKKIDKHLADAGIKRGTKFSVKSPVGETFTFEWVIRPVERAEYTMSFPVVKLEEG